jgi:hypothetical protein
LQSELAMLTSKDTQRIYIGNRPFRKPFAALFVEKSGAIKRC